MEIPLRRDLGLLTVAVLLALLVAPVTTAARKRPLELRHHQLELPGAPAALIDVDLNHDGLRDLVVVVAYTEIENIGVDRIEDMVQISTVIPALFDRREARVWLGRPDGSLEGLEQPFVLDDSVLALAPGPAAAPLLALTDDGVAAVTLATDSPQRLILTPLVTDTPVIRGARSFFSSFDWVHDLDDDGTPDVVFPGRAGPVIYLSTGDAVSTEPTQRIDLPTERRGSNYEKVWRRYPFPEVHDVTGDGFVDLVFRDSRRIVHVLAGGNDGTFDTRFRQDRDGQAADCPAAGSIVSGVYVGELAHFGDIDGDGQAELVSIEELEPEKDSMRANLRHAKKPRNRFRFYRVHDDMTVATEPYLEFVAIGHSFQDVDLDAAEINLFEDLDGDGRKDLITVTLEFSLFQALKILATKKISIGLDFHVWAQQPNGKFREVTGNDLSEKLRFNLNDLKLGRLAQFKGDYDGDGRIDFVHFGRGKEVTIHRGQPGARYSKKPDLVIKLEEPPQDLGLVRVMDLDGDGRSDLAFTRILPVERADVSAPVLVDLYLSGGTR